MQDNTPSHSEPISEMLDPVVAAEARVRHSVFSDRMKGFLMIFGIVIILLTLVGLFIFLLWSTTDIDKDPPIGYKPAESHITYERNAATGALIDSIVTLSPPTPIIIPVTAQKQPSAEAATVLPSPTTLPTTSGIRRTVESIEADILTNNEGSGEDSLKRILSNEIRENCYQHLIEGGPSGLYLINPYGSDNEPFTVYCDMETDGGGWAVVQRRIDASGDFQRKGFRYYDQGFGDLLGSHWLGLSKMRRIAPNTAEPQILRIELRGDFCKTNGCSRQMDDGYWWGDYEFSLGSAKEHYPIYLGENQLAGNLSTEHPSIKWNVLINGRKFTTAEDGYDFDDIKEANCAQMRLSGPWWHKDCTLLALNGKYGDSAQILRHTFFNRDSTVGGNYYIKPRQTLMMVRPRI